MPKFFAAIPIVLGVTLAGCASDLPGNSVSDRVVWLDQNWDDDERHWFHHASQGTSTLPVPYRWFMALEQPRLWLTGKPPLLSDPDYLQRFGFIPSSTTAEAGREGHAGNARTYGTSVRYDPDSFPGNPDGLPVGFARTPGYPDPVTGRPLPDQIGFTCAACHTGHLEYDGASLRIDGAPAMTDLGLFRDTIGRAIGYTSKVPGRFDRFARRVLGDGYNEEARAALEAEFDALVERGEKIAAMKEPFAAKSVEEGFGRLDALNRIGNQVFAMNLLDADATEIPNYAPITAPVNFPPIWDAPWFDWVQYDGSIMQPMVRNAGEALGVSARVNLIDPTRTLFASSVKFTEIDAMEQMLAGDDPLSGEPGFKGLRAPVWPEEILGRIDPVKRDRGRVLYEELCQGCHLPAVDDPNGSFWSGPHWYQPDGAENRYLKLKRIKAAYVGTDPAQATVLVSRRMQLPAHLGIDPGELCGDEGTGVVTEAVFANALAMVVEKTADVWYDDNDIGPEERERMNGHRPNCVRGAPPAYKARPLDGIWATPPFLHNGSVPSLWALLSPIDEGLRPTTFCLGSRAFDPQKIGYSTDCAKGLFKLDTSLPGNSNAGHEFADKPRGKGVIGRKLAPEERWALIEFLKSTPSY